MTLDSYFASLVPRIEEEMRHAVGSPRATRGPSKTAAPPRAFTAMLNYHLGFAGATGESANVYSGKRIRPVLTLLTCEACGGNVEQALPAAVAVELLHNFSLIHDDIEDRDELRRGRPTLWKVWGEAQAINTGDAMFALAHTTLQSALERGALAGRVLHALQTFDAAAVALTIGQHQDLSFEHRSDVSIDEYTAMIRGKTGALTEAACEIGATLAGATDARISSLADFGAWLGIAFQLQDDVLGIWGDPDLTGKHDSDLSHRKKTLPVLYAAEREPRVREMYFLQTEHAEEDIERLRQLIEVCGGRDYTERAARDAHNRSLAALDAARLDGPAAQALRELAYSLLGRAS